VARGKRQVVDVLTGQPVTTKEAERGAAASTTTATTATTGGFIPPDFSRTSFSWTEATPITFDYQSIGSYLSPNRVPESFSGESAKYWLLNLKRINQPRYQSVVEGLWQSGYLGKVKNPLSLNDQQIQRGYEDFLGYTQAQQQLARGSGQMAPSFTELLAITAQQAAANRAQEGGGGGPFRSETTSVTEYDETNVTDIANNAARQRLGRAATKKERELLATALNEAQRKNPMVTISEGTTAGGVMTDDGGQRTARGTVSTTTQRGGIDAAEIAQEQAVQAEDFEERFFVSTFTDMLKSLSKPAV
jgi:hypothetical protein